MRPRAAPILCFEGPSAVGKTATAEGLAATHGAHVVPEVNALFERPVDEAPDWYLERQVDRWTRASAEAARCPLVVLDGDPFQPLWYNWAYGFAGWQSLDSLEAFYRPRLARSELSFPDLYVVFGASVEVLRDRKTADPTRQRRGFESHLRFIEPQRRYFETMQRLSPGRVCFLDARGVDASVRAVSDVARHARGEERPEGMFDHLVGWLRENPAA